MYKTNNRKLTNNNYYTNYRETITKIFIHLLITDFISFSFNYIFQFII